VEVQWSLSGDKYLVAPAASQAKCFDREGKELYGHSCVCVRAQVCVSVCLCVDVDFLSLVRARSVSMPMHRGWRVRIPLTSLRAGQL
jgi:hypothetical protein